VVQDSELSSHPLPVVDVTALYAYPRTTGIQRVVRDIIGDGKELRLVRYSTKQSGYVLVQRLPELTPRDEGRIGGAIRRALKNWAYQIWLGFGRVAETGLLRGAYNRIRKSASLFYSNFLSDATLETHGDLDAEERVELFPDDALWLLDIPKTPEHLGFIKTLASADQCKLGIYVYDMIPVDFPEMIGGPASEEIKQSYLDYLELVPLASQVFFLSHYTRERYRAFAVDSGVRLPDNEKVVYPPLDFSRYDNLKEIQDLGKTRELARYLSATVDGPRILCVSPLNERKNVKVVLRALLRLLQEGSQIVFLLVAPTLSAADPESVDLVRTMRRGFPNNVLVTNQISDEELVASYLVTDIVVMPSVVEGFGLPIVEGLHFGCHVTASDMTAFIELGAIWPIQLLPAYDDQAWTESLRALITKPALEVSVKEYLPSPAEFRRLMGKLLG